MNIFSEDNAFGRGFRRIMDMIAVNFMWLLCCVPLVTIGASTAALYDRTMKMAREEDGDGLVRPFFASFFRNLLRGTGLFALALVVGALIYVDYVAATQLGGMMAGLCQVVIIASLLLYIGTLSHSFMVLSHFNTGVFQTVKLAFIHMMGGGWRSILIGVLFAAPVILFVVAPLAFLQTGVVWATVAVALIAYINCTLFCKRFQKEEEEAE